MELVKSKKVKEAKDRMTELKRLLNLEKQDKLKKLKETMIDKRPPLGGSMIGESYGDFMLGGGNIQDIKNSLDKQNMSSSLLQPSMSSPKNKEQKKNQKLNAALIRKAMINQP